MIFQNKMNCIDLKQEDIKYDCCTSVKGFFTHKLYSLQFLVVVLLCAFTCYIIGILRGLELVEYQATTYYFLTDCTLLLIMGALHQLAMFCIILAFVILFSWVNDFDVKKYMKQLKREEECAV